MSTLKNSKTLVQNPMRRLFRYLGNYKKSLWFAISSSIINKVFDLMPPFLTAWMIDSVSGNVPIWIEPITGLIDPWQIIIFLAILTFIVFGMESFFEWLFKRGFMRLAQNVQHDLRMDAYNQLQNRELAFFEKERTGNLMAILNDDINQLERFLNNSFYEIIHMITLVIFAGLSLCWVSPTLGLIGMLPIPFIVWGSIYYQKGVAPFYKKTRESVGFLSNRLENNISGIQVIKSFTAEKFESQRLAYVSKEYQDANFKAIRWSAAYIPLIRMVIALGFSAVLLIGSYWILNDMNGFTFGALAFFAMMIQRLLWPVTALGRISDEYERAKASSRRIFKLVDTPPQFSNPALSQTPLTLSGNISLDNIHFKYDQGKNILNNIQLDIKAKQMIGIVGPTGAGKTTLIKLLLRFYDVTKGSIKIDGINIKDFNLQQFRKQIALVSQDVYLFHGTIKENIAYGHDHFSIGQIQEAAKKAKLHEFIISLEHEYDSIIGERGIKLSGGQKQRLSIARAILKDAPILILDEATSSVDSETEKAIQQNLHQLSNDKTAIIIAHRLSTIRHSNVIIVLKNGKIVEKGSHDLLLDKKGIYADLWNTQLGL